MENLPLNANRHLRFQKCLPTECSQSANKVTNRLGDVNAGFPRSDRSIRMEDLRAGRAVSRRYRNRRIGEFLKELDLTEGRSTGIPKMLRIMEANGSTAPEFDSDEDRTYYLARLPVHPQAEIETGPVTGEEGIKQGLSRDQVTGEVTGEVFALLRELSSPISRKELQDKLGLKSQANFRDRYLDPALAGKVIEMTQPDSPKSPTQKYRLTEKGRKILENQ